MNWIHQIFQKLFPNNSKIIPVPIIPEKDPNDNTLTVSSTEWKTENYHCVKCLKSSTHNSYMAQICNSCGTFGTITIQNRIFRKIFYNGEWQYQIKYRQTFVEKEKTEIRKDWY